MYNSVIKVKEDTIMNMSTNQSNVVKKALEHPEFRFKFLKKLTGDHEYSKHYNRHWKLQVAYFKNAETGQLLFEDVPEEFFADDGEGEYMIESEDYKKEYERKKQ